MTKLDDLAAAGQSVWYDFIRRDMIEDGMLADLVASGVRGLTSNPSIFEQAIARSDLYDRQVAELGEASPEAVFDAIAIADISAAADVLRPVYDATHGGDGYVSLEVSPRLAHDTAGTVEDAVRLWRIVDRPNLMIKVPATAAGLPAIEELIASGVNVNATLMFSLSDYEGVATAFLDGAARGHRPGVASVASFFVSRVDTAFDAELAEVGSPEALALRGTIAIANAKAAYRRYQELFEGERFAPLAARGTRSQRVLWASTSTKNPAYRDVMYVEDLIGPQTVNTAPPATIEAFEDHGEVVPDSLLTDVDEALAALASLADLGIDYDTVTSKLQVDGVAAFSDAYESLLRTIADKQASVRT